VKGEIESRIKFKASRWEDPREEEEKKKKEEDTARLETGEEYSQERAVEWGLEG